MWGRGWLHRLCWWSGLCRHHSQKNAERKNLKRKVSTKSPDNQKNKQPKPLQALHRTFENYDSESCWLNSCLQLVLTAIEQTGYFEEDRSLLWCQLIKLINNGKSPSLDPIPIRDIIMTREREQILRGNIAPMNRLFDLGSAEVFQA